MASQSIYAPMTIRLTGGELKLALLIYSHLIQRVG